jgi:hypothetical protein
MANGYLFAHFYAKQQGDWHPARQTGGRLAQFRGERLVDWHPARQTGPVCLDFQINGYLFESE